MGDFLLDFRPKEKRACEKAGAFLKFFPDMKVDIFDQPEFGLVVTSSDDQRLWGPSQDGSLLVMLAGRISIEQREWEAAQKLNVPGGLACRFIADVYRKQGISGVEALSGNFAILIFDRTAKKFFVVTDRWGMYPAFQVTSGLTFASHPDALADAVGESTDYDETSFAEFILTCRLAAPNTYYKGIKSLPIGSTVTIDVTQNSANVRQYFDLNPQLQSAPKLADLADEFAAAFKKAIANRTLPSLGRSALGLSGGLDSRTVLSSVPNRDDLVTFSCYDSETPEFKIARDIASAVGAKFVPLKRDFDFYGNNAALGARISAGMGCIASNHFLGFRKELRDLGVDNLLTGCYCDYVFKGLAINKKVNRWTTRESLGQFNFSYYANHFGADSELQGAVFKRLENLFPANLRSYGSEAAVLEAERRRVFPLCYEEDNAERIIPQRTMGWYVPIADNGLMDVYQKMSLDMRLNDKLFLKMVKRVCPPAVRNIPNANTGAPVDATLVREAFNSHARRVRGALQKLKRTNATTGSWLNWGYYVNNSAKVRELWQRPNKEAREVFKRVLGSQYSDDIGAYRGKSLYIFLQLFTLKLWFDQRAQQ
jgi:asparagine synthase (glutamine-hydrolysing)